MELDEDRSRVITGHELVVYDWCACLNRLSLLTFVGLWLCCIVLFYTVVFLNVFCWWLVLSCVVCNYLYTCCCAGLLFHRINISRVDFHFAGITLWMFIYFPCLLCLLMTFCVARCWFFGTLQRVAVSGFAAVLLVAVPIILTRKSHVFFTL